MAILNADDLKFGAPEYQQMAKVQHEVDQLLLRQFAETTEVALIIFALARCLRALLHKYPGRMQAFILAAVLPFLRSETRPEGVPATAAERASSLLIH